MSSVNVGNWLSIPQSNALLSCAKQRNEVYCNAIVAPFHPRQPIHLSTENKTNKSSNIVGDPPRLCWFYHSRENNIEGEREREMWAWTGACTIIVIRNVGRAHNNSMAAYIFLLTNISIIRLYVVRNKFNKPFRYMIISFAPNLLSP